MFIYRHANNKVERSTEEPTGIINPLVRIARLYKYVYGIAAIIYVAVLHWEITNRWIAACGRGEYMVPTTMILACVLAVRLKADDKNIWPRRYVFMMWLAIILANGFYVLCFGNSSYIGSVILIAISVVCALTGFSKNALSTKGMQLLIFLCSGMFFSLPLTAGVMDVWARVIAYIAASVGQLLPGAEIVRTGRHVICQSAHLFVADECAGLRSLKTMVVVGMFISFWQRNTIICCFLIPVISAILAFMGNILRICFVFWAVIFWGPALEIGSWHAWSGNIVLAVEIILIWKIAEKISVTKYRVYRDPAADKVIISGE